jgi:hypothetical protein
MNSPVEPPDVDLHERGWKIHLSRRGQAAT